MNKCLYRGFAFVELLIAITLIAIFVPATIKSLSFSLFASHQGEQFTQAYALAQEGMEGIYILKSEGGSAWDWTTTPLNTSGGSYYQPEYSGGTWTLGSINSFQPPLVNHTPFTRTVEIEEVQRCSTPNPKISEICPSGIVDSYTRKITVLVTWSEAGTEQSVYLDSYVTAH